MCCVMHPGVEVEIHGRSHRFFFCVRSFVFVYSRQKPLEEAMASAEADRVDAVRRLTRKDGDLVAVRPFSILR